MSLFKITGGTVYDPANQIDGQVRDLWIEDGRIVAAPTDATVRPARTIDAAGLIVMPGGVDMHCHIAGSKVNLARRLRSDDKRTSPPVERTSNTRSGTMGSVPSTFATGYKYAGLGYTTAFDAAIPPLYARHAHEEFADTPCLDKGFYVLVGNNHYVMRSIRDGESERLRSFLAWLLGATKAFGTKIVNPGGIETWKGQRGGNIHDLDETVAGFDVTPRQIIQQVAQAVDELALPHSVHIHANNLGLPGNWTTTLETMRALEGRRGHMTHIQFHSYAGGEADESTFGSQVTPLADYVNQNPNITVDVGQVMFGNTTSMTGDSPVGYYLSNLYQSRWVSGDSELESGCGIAPIEYKNSSRIHALQWAIGLEWYLMVDDPWRVVMSTDHPNGGSFLAYPHIIRLLMDRTYRRDLLKKAHPDVQRRSTLADLDREYTLGEIAIITRAGPARILGLRNKGHLGVGADADITIYTPGEDREAMFAAPRFVIKAGQVIVEQGELRTPVDGRLLYAAPEYDTDVEADIAAWFDEHYSVRFRNYAVGDHELHDVQRVECLD